MNCLNHNINNNNIIKDYGATLTSRFTVTRPRAVIIVTIFSGVIGSLVLPVATIVIVASVTVIFTVVLRGATVLIVPPAIEFLRFLPECEITETLEDEVMGVTGVVTMESNGIRTIEVYKEGGVVLDASVVVLEEMVVIVLYVE